MSSTGPAVPISVDSETGVWTTDGQAMVYLPRHFYVNHHLAIGAALGRQRYAELLYQAGHKSAWQWCAKESLTHGLRGVAVFRHYMHRISQRGWGIFTIEQVDEDTGAARVRLDHSIYVLSRDQRIPGDAAEDTLCYAFAGWLPGALEWAATDMGQDWNLRASEVQCAGDGVHDHCVFEVMPEFQTNARP